jgi:hypothetical protein
MHGGDSVSFHNVTLKVEFVDGCEQRTNIDRPTAQRWQRSCRTVKAIQFVPRPRVRWQ